MTVRGHFVKRVFLIFLNNFPGEKNTRNLKLLLPHYLYLIIHINLMLLTFLNRLNITISIIEFLLIHSNCWGLRSLKYSLKRVRK